MPGKSKEITEAKPGAEQTQTVVQPKLAPAPETLQLQRGASGIQKGEGDGKCVF